MSAIVFLDRDGVLNRCRDAAAGPPLPPRSLSELRLLPGVRRACRLLRDRGYSLVAVTNQPDVARKTQSRAEVEAMNAWIAEALELDDIRVCWHDDDDGCECRKPKPGLLQQAAVTAGVDLNGCFMVGDRWRDIEAGNRAGCTTALIGDGYGETFRSPPNYRARSLLEVAQWITSARIRPNRSTTSCERLTVTVGGSR
jgi:D-glycero-D-manno-heptose 1,7-bisphosphate phosphatase